MPWIPQGIELCVLWSKLFKNYTLVAIGGINESNIQSLIKKGIKNIAVISAITTSKSYEESVRNLMHAIEN